MLPRVIDYDHDVSAIDTRQEREQMAACYLLRGGGEWAFVDCGTSHSVPSLLALLDARGIRREQLRYVMPTHVHLDHAGGAGALMAACPNAQLVVHPRGVRHLVDPAALIAGASVVYGHDGVRKMYGEVLPVAADRVVEAVDGLRLTLGDRELLFLDAPGHAKHHYMVWDARSRGFFTGDVFGISYREFDTGEAVHLMPTTSPVQFDPDAWRATLLRIAEYRANWAYLTHYGRIGELSRQIHTLQSGLDAYCDLALRLRSASDRHACLKEALTRHELAALRALGCTMDEASARNLLEMDMELDAQGLEVWLDPSH